MTSRSLPHWLAPLITLAVPFAGCGRVGYDELPLAVARQVGRGDGSTGGTDAGSLDAASGGGATGSGAAGVLAGTGGRSGSGGMGMAGSDSGRPGDAGTDATDGSPDGSRCPSPPSAVADYCLELPELPGAPVIDGLLDCGVALHSFVPVGWTGGATPPDATSEYAVAWRPDGMYFFVRVHDPSFVPAGPTLRTWQGDAVELYADNDGAYKAPPNYDDPGSRQFVVAGPTDATSTATRAEVWHFGNAGAFTVWTSTEFGAFGRPDGYVVEAFVTGADLGLSTWGLAAGAAVGMDLSIDVSYPTAQGPDAGPFGNRLGQYFLRTGELDSGTAVLPPFDVRAFCRPTLVAN